MKYLAGIYVIIFLFSCKKESKPPVNGSAAGFSDVFNDFWNKMNTNYVYWDIDTTNWDNVYKKFHPLFSQLDIHDTADVRMSVAYFKEMTKGLIDCHYYISFDNPIIKDSSVYPALMRKEANKDFHYPYSYLTIDSNYLDKEYEFGYDNVNTINHQPTTVLKGIIRDKILYFSCNQFALFRSYHSNAASGVKTILNNFFEELKAIPAQIKGIIIDVRGNLGGDVSDLNFLVGRFIDSPLHFGATRYRVGNDRTDYTSWVDAMVNPQTGAKKITLPIVVLADNYSASVSEAVTMAIRALPNGIVVGEHTWGATGPLVSTEVYNDGPFQVKDFLSVQTSSAEFKYLDGKVYEEAGFPPDVPMVFNIDSFTGGHDLPLEKAISLIN